MKALTLIKRLYELVKKHGNLDIEGLPYYGSGFPVGNVRVMKEDRVKNGKEVTEKFFELVERRRDK